ncbi:MAG: hypothetical protein PHS92_02500 [Candidatus Gracilibacteria bacterium]|nr:hypothetical protein [Candidatus Gracilibacteria bacterium]
MAEKFKKNPDKVNIKTSVQEGLSDNKKRLEKVLIGNIKGGCEIKEDYLYCLGIKLDLRLEGKSLVDMAELTGKKIKEGEADVTEFGIEFENFYKKVSERMKQVHQKAGVVFPENADKSMDNGKRLAETERRLNQEIQRISGDMLMHCGVFFYENKDLYILGYNGIKLDYDMHDELKVKEIAKELSELIKKNPRLNQDDLDKFAKKLKNKGEKKINRKSKTESKIIRGEFAGQDIHDFSPIITKDKIKKYPVKPALHSKRDQKNLDVLVRGLTLDNIGPNLDELTKN